MNDGPGVNLLANFHKKRVSSSGLFIYVAPLHLWNDLKVCILPQQTKNAADFSPPPMSQCCALHTSASAEQFLPQPS